MLAIHHGALLACSELEGERLKLVTKAQESEQRNRLPNSTAMYLKWSLVFVWGGPVLYVQGDVSDAADRYFKTVRNKW